jgi:hypothetical protein
MIADRLFFLTVASVMVAVLPVVAAAQETAEKTVFRIKYIAQGAVYLEGGRAAGLNEGQKLIVKRDIVPPVNESGKPSIPVPSSVVAELLIRA